MARSETGHSAVATCNDISKLPPEFARADRFDGVFYPADLGGLPEVVDGCPALLQTVAKRLQRDVQSDLVAKFEAVGDGLRWSVHAHHRAGDAVLLDFRHKKPGEAPKGKDAPKLTKEQKREYHAEALHDNCEGCHKEFNKKYKPKKAPVTCNDCHPKKD